MRARLRSGARVRERERMPAAAYVLTTAGVREARGGVMIAKSERDRGDANKRARPTE